MSEFKPQSQIDRTIKDLRKRVVVSSRYSALLLALIKLLTYLDFFDVPEGRKCI